MKIELNEHEALTLYRLLCRWESTGELTVGINCWRWGRNAPAVGFAVCVGERTGTGG